MHHDDFPLQIHGILTQWRSTSNLTLEIYEKIFSSSTQLSSTMTQAVYLLFSWLLFNCFNARARGERMILKALLSDLNLNERVVEHDVGKQPES